MHVLLAVANLHFSLLKRIFAVKMQALGQPGAGTNVWESPRFSFSRACRTAYLAALATGSIDKFPAKVQGYRGPSRRDCARDKYP